MALPAPQRETPLGARSVSQRGHPRLVAGERARLDGLGKPAPYVDGQIAAIAHVNGLALVTTNTKDFRRFKDVRVENWSTRQAGHQRSL